MKVLINKHAEAVITATEMTRIIDHMIPPAVIKHRAAVGRTMIVSQRQRRFAPRHTLMIHIFRLRIGELRIHRVITFEVGKSEIGSRLPRLTYVIPNLTITA